jgi:hypothetical protein
VSSKALAPIATCSTVILCIYFILSGQQFLAHNTYNDADSSYFAYGGWLLTQGGKLYVDFWDQKPPLIFYQNALLIQLFGFNFTAWAWVHSCAFALGLYFLFRQLKFWLEIRLALVCSVIVAFGFNLNNYLDYGNRTEFGVAWFEMLALACMLKFFRGAKIIWLFWAGACAAASSLFKPIGIASLLATLALCASGMLLKNSVGFFKTSCQAEGHPTSLRGFVVMIFWTCLGFLTCGSIILYPLASEGLLGEVWKATFTIPLSLSGGTGKSLTDAALDLPKKMGPLWGFLWPWLLWPWALLKAKPQQRTVLAWVTLWTLATLCGIILMRHGHPHYYHPAVVPLLVGACLCLGSVSMAWEDQRWHKLALVLLLSTGFIFSRYFLIRQFQQVRQLKTYEASYEPYVKLGAWLNQELGTSSDCFYYWSMGYSPYLQAQKICPGIISPCILSLGDNGAQMVLDDLVKLQARKDILFLVENPETFPKDIAQPEAYAQDSIAHKTIAEYCRWRGMQYERIEAGIPPFLIYRRNP